MVDKFSKVPLHYQVYLELLSKIQSGVFKHGEKIPTEPQLEELFGVSRVTIRRAVEMLAQEGVLEKHRGKKGTIVSNIKHDYDIRKLTSFSDDVRLYGEEPHSELIAFEEIPAPQYIAECLHINPSEMVYYIERKRFRSDEVVGIHQAYIRKLDNVCLEKSDFDAEASLYALLRNHGIVPERARENLEVRIPGDDILSILGLPDKTAVFYKDRITFTQEGMPFEYVEMYYNPSCYRYSVELTLTS